MIEFSFSNTKERFQQGDRKYLTLSCTDSGFSYGLFRHRSANILVTDLPYGIQHAASSDHHPDSLLGFLHRVLPVWKKTLSPGGAIAMSFNTLTLPTSAVRNELLKAGFLIPALEGFTDLRHEVEQAVVRDVVFALNTKEE